MPVERAGLEQLLVETHRHARIEAGLSIWRMGNMELVLAVSGVGRKAAAASARMLVDRGARTVVSAGLAAGLAPEAEVGDVVTARSVLHFGEERRRAIATNPRITAALPPSGTLGIRVSECDLITSDSVICDAQQKQSIHHSTGAAALDMESYAIGEVCVASGVPFAVIRAISDTAEQDLPPQLPMLITGSDLRRLAIMLGHPNIIPALLRLRAQSNRAIHNLAEVLATLILRLI